MSYCLNYFELQIFLLSAFKPMYLLESNIPNECTNIFMRRKKSRMNVRIYSLWKNPRIFEQMNIFVNKYSNIFKYPDIRQTLVGDMLRRDFKTCSNKAYIVKQLVIPNVELVGLDSLTSLQPALLLVPPLDLPLVLAGSLAGSHTYTALTLSSKY